MNGVPGLSERLRGILEYELARGNLIARIDSPAGTRCPFAVVLAKPLDIRGYKDKHGLPAGTDTWENHDRHYPLEAGFVCERTRHAIAGPIN
jgi:hypothetical protein